MLRRFAFFFGLQDPVVKGDQVLPERAVDFAEGNLLKLIPAKFRINR